MLRAPVSKDTLLAVESQEQAHHATCGEQGGTPPRISCRSRCFTSLLVDFSSRHLSTHRSVVSSDPQPSRHDISAPIAPGSTPAPHHPPPDPEHPPDTRDTGLIIAVCQGIKLITKLYLFVSLHFYFHFVPLRRRCEFNELLKTGAAGRVSCSDMKWELSTEQFIRLLFKWNLPSRLLAFLQE